ncbi:DUF397 domain-containing protein [Microtetraspora sp. NBRC 13810]|uniref:DUF397 domain-containing protein n=1 Tax=Microtetraspora sp. NBRC 13810 TaxID=3030990 RepID=UPI0024A039DD|nr:DUF397 domain-containing protein [Microtetraspora sp. NBRC 13810]GLW08425.1 DUF397 domain-containing protein [Microtetraspora sp. NBRC 13810]
MTAELTHACWRRSSHSGDAGNCVEVAEADGVIGVRDSKMPGGEILTFGTAAWGAFLQAAKDGEFDPSG